MTKEGETLLFPFNQEEKGATEDEMVGWQPLTEWT